MWRKTETAPPVSFPVCLVRVGRNLFRQLSLFRQLKRSPSNPRPFEQNGVLAILRLVLFTGCRACPERSRRRSPLLPAAQAIISLPAMLVGKSADEHAALRSDSHTFGRAAVVGVANRLVGDGTFVQSNLDQLALTEIEM